MSYYYDQNHFSPVTSNAFAHSIDRGFLITFLDKRCQNEKRYGVIPEPGVRIELT